MSSRHFLRHPAQRERPAYVIQSVDSALRLLHMFLVSESIRVSDAAVQLGVAPSTAHRLLAMLQFHGFVAHDRHTHTYHAGPDLVRFGLAVAKQLDLRQQARPILEALSAQADETVHLGALQGGNVLYIDGIEGGRVLRVGSRAGACIPLHCVSMGKVLLASLSRERFDELYPSEQLTTLTAQTLTTKTALAKQLAAIRKQGYAQSCSESDDGVGSVARAVFGGNGEVRAAISIAAPATRMTADRIAEWVRLLRDAVAELSSRCA
jgi:IclR family acetate operon transcriptional repressor